MCLVRSDIQYLDWPILEWSFHTRTSIHITCLPPIYEFMCYCPSPPLSLYVEPPLAADKVIPERRGGHYLPGQRSDTTTQTGIVISQSQSVSQSQLLLRHSENSLSLYYAHGRCYTVFPLLCDIARIRTSVRTSHCTHLTHTHTHHTVVTHTTHYIPDSVWCYLTLPAGLTVPTVCHARLEACSLAGLLIHTVAPTQHSQPAELSLRKIKG